MKHNQHLTDLVHLVKEQGIRNVIICPGSRNAPLIQLFTRDDYFSCTSIVDERSAAYVALGMARELNKPVIVVTTSGTASLNLGPAVAEAFFQQVPLVLITADRPREWPPQFSNQVVNQAHIFSENSKDSLSLPLDINGEDELMNELAKCKALLHLSESGIPGPVHLNIPMKEPLYEPITDRVSDVCNKLKGVHEEEKRSVSDRDQIQISKFLKAQKKVLIIIGTGSYSAEQELLLVGLSVHYNLVIIAENISNLKAPHFINQPELVLGSLKESHEEIKPDLIMTMGAQIVSKKTRLFVQDLEQAPILNFNFFPSEMFNELVLGAEEESEYSYLSEWKKIEKKALAGADAFLSDNPFCNLTAIGGVLNTLPDNSVLHLGNSSTIRTSQLFPQRNDIQYFCNRGTSGIDGSLSTAVGAAMVSAKLHIVVLGDLSFVYDSNAMWNRSFPENLKIIVINDQGGGIFRLLSGPDTMPFFEDYSVASHPVSHVHLSGAFGLSSEQVSDYMELNKGLHALFEEEGGPDVLEILTAQSENSSIFKKFYKSLQNE